jgi:hypothetical protein
MKKLLLFSCTLFCTLILSAQKVYYLYLQTDDQAPFYVRMSDKIYSSAVSGFLIMPNLTDSTYNMNIGFAKSTKPETKFAVTIHRNDKGYLIKNFDDGLGLFDLQDLSILKSVSANKDNTIYETKTDKFSSILSKAADDPSLLKVPVVKKEEPVVSKIEEQATSTPKEEEKTETKASKENTSTATDSRDNKNVGPGVIIPGVVLIDNKSDTQTTKQPEEIKQPVKEDTTQVETLDYKPSVVTRRSESSTTEGFGIIYYDAYEGKTDTIRILIPPSKSKITEDAEGDTKELEKKVDTPAVINQNEIVIPKVVEENNKKTVENLNPNCKSTALEKDFMKLRKNMAAKDNDEAMIEEAKKSFKSKCYTVEQVRYLSTLFLTSAAKYQFFDAAYEHVTDKKEFASLQSELKDEYYLKRFKALIGE